MQEADTKTAWGEREVSEILGLKSGNLGSQYSVVSDVVTGVNRDTSTKLDRAVEVIVASLSADQLRLIAKLDVDQQVPGEYDGRLLTTSRARLAKNLDESEKRYLRERFKQAARDALA